MSSEQVLRLNLLGSLEAVSSGPAGERRLGRGKPVALLAFLALIPGRRASRERLSTLLWSEGSSDQARQNLRQTIWYLKRRLGEVVDADDESIALVADATSDVDRFIVAAASRPAEAIERYVGDFVAGFAAPGAVAFEEWAELERRRLRAVFVSCVESVARALMSSGHAADAVRLAVRGRELAVEEQGIWRLHLECLIAARDLLGLAAAVAQLTAMLEHEELDPDPALQSLLRVARRALGTADVVEEALEPGGEESLVPDLIGREEDFRALVDAWESARRGRGRTIVISGAAGLGKSRLLADFAARVQSTRGRFVQVRAHTGNRTIVGGLSAQVAEALARIPGAAAVPPGSASALVALAPSLASAFPGAEPDRATGEDAIRRRTLALGDLLGVLCESSPLALLIDDAHWSDAESMRTLAGLCPRVEGAKALMVIASRVADDLCAHLGPVEVLRLQPFDVADVAEFVGRLASLPAARWSHGLVPRLHELSHGIPLLLIETLQRLVENGALRRIGGSWDADSVESLAAAIPQESALQARLASLDRSERTLLLRLATLGRPIAVPALTASDDSSDWSTKLLALERRGFVSRSEDRVSAAHDEVARSVLELALPADRLEAHGWVSDLLAGRADSIDEHRLALLHAARSADAARTTRVWLAALRWLRSRGERRGARRIADELIPTEVGPAERERLVRATPISARLTMTVVRAAAALIVALVSLAAWQWRDAVSRPPALRLFLTDETATSPLWMISLPLDEGWSADDPLTARMVPAESAPWHGKAPRFPLGPWPGGGWVVQTIEPDSTGDELAILHPDGRVQRISPAAGDDNGPSASPDGREMVYYTRRFDRREHQAELVRYDLATGALTRLTATEEDEVGPLWSPDGTRLAFSRHFQTRATEPATCVRSVIGGDEVCDFAMLLPGSRPIAWVDASRLLTQSMRTRQLFLIDVDRRQAAYLGTPRGDLQFLPGSRYVACQCTAEASHEQQWMVAPLSAPLELRPIFADGRPLLTTRIAIDRAEDRDRYLERVELSSASAELPLGASGLVEVRGFDALGSSIPLRALQLRSSDTSVLRVRPDGTLLPVSLGAATIHAVAGGWREAHMPVAVTHPAGSALMDEDWKGGFNDRWRTFGVPLPNIVRTEAGAALSPNGDGVYASGVYSTVHFPASQGLTVRFRMQAPVTRFKMQTITVSLLRPVSPGELESWDHRTASGPFSRSSLCATGFPATEGGMGALMFVVASRTSFGTYSRGRPAPDFYSARWHEIVLQYALDGRCVLYVDGEEVVRSEHPATLADSAFVMVTGNSVGARMLLGRLQVTQGMPATPARHQD